MATDVAIRVESIGKMYRIGSKQPYGRLSELITRIGRSVISLPSRLIRKPDPKNGKPATSNEFWALREVSFDVAEGEVLGVIGRNGAGKSTLLKILSRVTEPTTGRYGVLGRVGSLLEVGTGFHPELTGRENIFLSGSILGMRRNEIRRRFDEIVEFAEIGAFLDTPVKRYSSGMYVRLGFAIAAHLEPEILIVDEVLAVGDTAFQDKCLGKMKDVAGQGRTVVFVSHNLGAVSQLCGRCVVLNQGMISFIGPSTDAVEHYLSPIRTGASDRSVELESDPSKSICLRSVKLVRDGTIAQTPIDVADQLEVQIGYDVHLPLRGVYVRFHISRDGIPVFSSWDTDKSPSLFENRVPGSYSARIRLPAGLLKAGKYSISVGAGFAGIETIAAHNDVIAFEIEELVEDLTRFSYGRKWAGSLILPLDWSHERVDDET